MSEPAQGLRDMVARGPSRPPWQSHLLTPLQHPRLGPLGSSQRTHTQYFLTTGGGEPLPVPMTSCHHAHVLTLCPSEDPVPDYCVQETPGEHPPLSGVLPPAGVQHYILHFRPRVPPCCWSETRSCCHWPQLAITSCGQRFQVAVGLCSAPGGDSESEESGGRKICISAPRGLIR